MNRHINYWGKEKGERMVPSGPSQAVGRMKDWIRIVLIEQKMRRAVWSIPRSVRVMYHSVGFVLTKGVLT